MIATRSMLKQQIVKRTYSAAASSPQNLTVASSRDHCLRLLAEQDRSSYILHSYIPKPARDAFLAVRAFNIDTGKIGDSTSQTQLAKIRFDFWRSTIQRVFSGPGAGGSIPKEPVAVLLSHAVRPEGGIQLSKRFFLTVLDTREAHASRPPFRTLDSMCSYGEGIHSQLNYLVQEMMYSVSPKASEFLNANVDIAEMCHDLAAHIGQATGVAGMLRGFGYYASKGFVPLPVDLLAGKNLSQDAVLRYLGGETDGVDPQTSAKLSDVVFETATRANDHLISAASSLSKIKDALDNTLPDAIMIPALTSIPTKLYLERLEKYDFNIAHPKLMKKGSDWKLPYRSYKSYKLRSI